MFYIGLYKIQLYIIIIIIVTGIKQREFAAASYSDEMANLNCQMFI